MFELRCKQQLPEIYGIINCNVVLIHDELNIPAEELQFVRHVYCKTLYIACLEFLIFWKYLHISYLYDNVIIGFMLIFRMYTRLYRSGSFIPPIPLEEPPSDPVAPPHTAGSSASRCIATYGPPRVKERPWARDKRLGTRSAGDESKGSDHFKVILHHLVDIQDKIFN